MVVGGTSGLGKVIAQRLGATAVSKRTGHDVTDRELDLPDCDNLVFCLRYRGSNLRTQWGTEYFGPMRFLSDWAGTEKRERSVVFISSQVARTVSYQQPLAYHASKAAIEAMIRYYAVMLGPFGIRVNGVAPGSILKEENRNWYNTNGIGDALEEMLPLRRMVTVQDVAAVVEFLCSDAAKGITGQIITVDGGSSLINLESFVRQQHGV